MPRRPRRGSMRAGAIHHVALRVADPERSLRFYLDLLGLTEVRRFEEDGQLRSIWLQAGDAVVMLEREVKGAGPASGSGHVLAFAVSTLGEWEARLSAAGIAVLDRTPSTVFVSDPDGHRVGLSTYALPLTRPRKARGRARGGR